VHSLDLDLDYFLPNSRFSKHDRNLTKLLLVPMPSRKQPDQESMILFPWVSDNWCSLEEEQRRQRQRLAKLSPAVESRTKSILKGICTLYGTSPGTFCKICQVVHLPIKKNLLLLTDENNVNTSGFQSNEMKQEKADRNKKFKLMKKEMRIQAVQRMQHAVAALKHRRKTRERKMGVPYGTFRQDFSDTGGSTVTEEMNAAIIGSFKNQNISRKESRFKGRIKTKRGLLTFPKISQSNDNFDELEEEERITNLVRNEVKRKKKKQRAKVQKFARDREIASGRRRRSRRSKHKQSVHDEVLVPVQKKKRSWCWWRKSPNKYAGQG